MPRTDGGGRRSEACEPCEGELHTEGGLSEWARESGQCYSVEKKGLRDVGKGSTWMAGAHWGRAFTVSRTITCRTRGEGLISVTWSNSGVQRDGEERRVLMAAKQQQGGEIYKCWLRVAAAGLFGWSRRPRRHVS